MSWRGVARMLALAATAAVAVGCGIQDDAAPRALDPDAVPFDLLAPATTTTSSPDPLQPEMTTSIYLIDNDGFLRQVPRSVAGSENVRAVIAELLEGATDDEAASGLSSAITAETRLVAVKGPLNGLLVVGLSRELLDVTGERQRQALAQVVFTATLLPGVREILFEFDGQRAEVPNGEGVLTSEPLDREDFRRFDATVPTTSSVPSPP